MAANHATREKINWLLLEGVLIVASILLAFWIDAWWDGRKDALEEQEILVGLEVEFADLRDRLDLWANRNRAGAKLIERLLSESVTEMNLPELELALTHTILANVLDQGGALDALLASGRLERITDRDLRARLVKWPDWLEDIHTNDLSAREVTIHLIAPFLARYGFPGRTCDDPDRFFLACPAPGPVPPAYMELVEDPEFRATLIMRRAWLNVMANDHEMAREEADKILEILRSNLLQDGG